MTSEHGTEKQPSIGDNVKAMLANSVAELDRLTKIQEVNDTDVQRAQNHLQAMHDQRTAINTAIMQTKALVTAFRLSLGQPAIEGSIHFNPRPTPGA